MYKIIVYIEGDQPQEFPLEETPLVIGRGKACDIRVINESVSRKHAKLTIQGDSVFIEDLNSANGILINEKNIKKDKLTTFFPAHLSPQVTIQLQSQIKQRSKQRPIKTSRRTGNKNVNLAQVPIRDKMPKEKKILAAAACLVVAIGAFLIASEIMERNEKDIVSAPVNDKSSARSIVVKSKPESELCDKDGLKALCQAFRSNPKKGYGFYFEEGKAKGSVEYKELARTWPDGLKTKEDYRELISSTLNGGILNGLANLGAKALAIDFIQKNQKQEVHFTRCMIDLEQFFRGAKKGDLIPYGPEARKKLYELIIVIGI